MELGRRQFTAAGAALLGGAVLLEATGCGGGGQPDVSPTPKPSPSDTSPKGLPSNLADARGFAISVDTLRDLNETQIYQRFGLATGLGADSIRVDFDGGLANDTGEYDWSITDAIMSAAVRRGLGVTALVSYTAEQDRIAPHRSIYTDRPRPDASSVFADFAGAAARRYGKQGLRKFELWNEPNISPAGADPESYVALFRAASAQIRDANPRSLVAIGGLAPSNTVDGAMSPPDFLEALYNAGLKPTEFQAIAAHLYCYPVTPDQYKDWSTFSRVEDTSPSLDSVSTEHGDAGKAMWVSEFGAPTVGKGVPATLRNEELNTFNPDTGYVSPKFQAVSLVQMLTYRFRRANVTDRFIFSLIDTPDVTSIQDGFGVYDHEQNPKEAATAIRRVLLGRGNN